MMRHLDAKKKFVMYPRFIPVFLTNQLKNVPVPLDHFPINALTTKVFSFMVKKGKKISRNVTPLFPSMLAQPTEDEGAVSERPSETQPTPSSSHPSEDPIEPQPDPSLRPSSSNPIPDSILEGSSGNHGGEERKPAKSEPTVHKDPAFDDFDDIVDDAMDYMETEDAQDEGRTSSKTLELSLSGDTVVLEEKESKEKGVSTEDPVSTAQPKVSTNKLKKVQEEWEAEEEKKKLAEEEATKAAFTNEYDFIQARLNADKILAEKLQEEEREKFTIEQRAKFLHDTIAAQRRFLAQQRSEAIRNKLPTRNQLRNQMMTYLKHVGGYKHAQLNKKKFEEIQVMYEKVKRENERFIPIGSAEDDKLIEKMNKKAAGMDKEEVAKELESSKVEGPKENIRKRSGRRLKMKAPKRSKRQKTDSDHEKENQLRIFLKIVPEEEEKIDYEILGTMYPIINLESKFYDYGHFGRELIYYRVFRTDGSSRWIKTFSEMIKLFDRMDLVEIHSLVMKRFETTPPEGIDLLLLGDLRIMFESKEDDELWKNQEEWKLQS
ncbi:hypothetical protein Tco_0303144 [Tanacetum coccineum]